MIEDKELGLKIAESKEEKFWSETLEKCKEHIQNFKYEIEINEAIRDFCEKKLYDVTKGEDSLN